MQMTMFDVEHGHCSVVVAPSGELLMIDCGHNSTTGWRPSTWVLSQGRVIANLTVSNFDEDHVSDLSNVRRFCGIKSLSRNWNVTPEWIEQAKAIDGMGNGVSAVVTMMREYTAPAPQIDWGGLEIYRYCHTTSTFEDENSLSLVTFVRSGSIGLVFPGDLTRAGWLAFLAYESFQENLRKTNIFVASHHGRQDGYCAEVFNYCSPDIVLISDEAVKYDTQDTDYGAHATGILFDGKEIKKTLTTRKNGCISIEPRGAGYFVSVQRS